ncbi:MAG: O-antigen ligase family protein [Bacteroidales bacterium]|nr:O-antigen ligase family protein [Bacteroidales bacterium]
MGFKAWYIWFRQTPWVFKWFIIFIIFRPIIDNYYHLKYISPFLSPLNIVGVLTPVLCINAIIRFRQEKNITDLLFIGWSILVLISCTSILLFGYRNLLENLRFVLKLSLPIFLFPFLRILIYNKTQLEGVLTAFLYSCIIAASLMLYEILQDPIGTQVSRGITRYQAGYGDVMNYAIYITLGILGTSYFHLNKKKHIITNVKFLVIIGFCILSLVNIGHVTSYLVFITIITFYLLYLIKARIEYFILLLVFAAVFYSVYFDRLYEENIDPLIEYELQVIEGDRESRFLMHGRFGRWKSMWNVYANQPIAGKILGVFSSSQSYSLVGGGVHNDFLRILFLTGVMGFLFYIGFLMNLLNRIRILKLHDKFLLITTLVVLILFSITTLPTLYAPFMYPVLSIFAYFSQSGYEIIEDYELEENDRSHE